MDEGNFYVGRTIRSTLSDKRTSLVYRYVIEVLNNLS